ncbi:response regulator transcription factor [Sphingomonas sp. R3G8C]|uniref:response regulator transcription factor n=1 Tax=Novosphingobium rhizosphaerae TaxID=1551649 RepID=UPI0015CE78ED
MHCLVVEDDPVIAAHVLDGLRGAGRSADHAATGQAALDCMARARYDAVVLDRMLPDLGGLEVLRALNTLGAAGEARPPVLVLSALGSLADRIEGLEAGGDDYLAKPFAMEELLARLNAITRRRPVQPEGAGLAVGRLVLDPSRHCAGFDGRQALLNRKLYSLLAHMMRHADKVVTRDMLLEHVWGYAFAPTTNIVESNMSRLRTRLLELGIDPIETQRGHGYVLRSGLCA